MTFRFEKDPEIHEYVIFNGYVNCKEKNMSVNGCMFRSQSKSFLFSNLELDAVTITDLISVF